MKHWWRTNGRGLLAIAASAWAGCLWGGCDERAALTRPGAYLFGARLPHTCFLAAGHAEADSGDPDALADLVRVQAGLGQVNLRGGVRALPGGVEIAKSPEPLPPGAMADAALAEMRGSAGTRLTAGVLIARVRRPKTGEVIAAFAVTYEGHESAAAAEAALQRRAAEYFRRRWSDTAHELLRDQMRVETFVPRRAQGAVLVAAVFTDAVHPHRRFGRHFTTLREFSTQ